MKKLTCTSVPFFIFQLAITCLCCATAFSQTVFWTETFNNACTFYCTAYTGPNGTWTFTQPGANGSTHNIWFISCAENGNAPGTCGTGCGANASLHIGNDPNSLAGWLFCPTGDCGAAYDASSNTEITNLRAASPRVNCAGKGTITATFAYIGKGQAGHDYCVFEYSADDGATWAALTGGLTTVNTGCAGQGKWATVATVSLPATANNNPLVHVAFHWVNDGDGSGSDPSFAVNDLSISYTNPLPVEWLSFDAAAGNKKVLLQWATATEINNDHFEIERSSDAENFSAIGEVKGAGNSTEVQRYSFTDSKPVNGISYYRLRQVDVDGTPNYSSVVSAKCLNGDLAFTIVQPARSGSCMVKFQSSSAGNAKFILYNVLGEQVKEWTVAAHEGFNSAELNTEGINTCICSLIMTMSEGSAAKKVVFAE